jgi:hypothetical protein
MTVTAIYRLNPTTGAKEPAHLRADGYHLVDKRIPYTHPGAAANWRNLARMAVKAKTLDEAAKLIDLDYGIRVLTASGDSNYVYKDELVIES